MQSVLTPATLVLATVVQQLYTVSMPLTVLVLAQILVIVGVVTKTESLHEAMLEHSLIDEAIVVEQCTNAMHLVVVVDLSIEETVFDL